MLGGSIRTRSQDKPFGISANRSSPVSSAYVELYPIVGDGANSRRPWIRPEMQAHHIKTSINPQRVFIVLLILHIFAIFAALPKRKHGPTVSINGSRHGGGR